MYIYIYSPRTSSSRRCATPQNSGRPATSPRLLIYLSKYLPTFLYTYPPIHIFHIDLYSRKAAQR